MNIEYLNSRAMGSLGVQFLFVTANKYEKAELENRLVHLKDDTNTYYKFGMQQCTIGYLGSYLIAHLHLQQQGSTRPYASLLSINEAYKAIKPLCVILVGIAFGRDSNTQKIGDVLISQEIKPYGLVRRSSGVNGEIVTEDRNELIEAGHSIMSIVHNFAFWANHVNLRYKVHLGTLLSGEELVDNEKYKNYLVDTFSIAENSIIGGEMEAVGLTSVMSRVENMNWLVVKAICDWADGNKSENKADRQQLAAQNAVDACVKLLSTDDLTQLPNYRRTKKNYDENFNFLLINGYKMFYARNKYCYSLKALSKKINLTESELRDLESFRIVDGKPIFKRLKQKKALKLQAALHCGNELFESTYTEHEQFFFGNKDRVGLCPPERAKAVIFDFDGTLTIKERHVSTWQKIWEHLGYDLTICEDLHSRFSNGDISHEEWCEITTDYFVRKHLCKKDMLEIAQTISLLPGTIEVLQELDKYGIPVYICSGSIDIIIESVLGDLARYVKRIASNKFAYDASGKRLIAILGTKYDFKGKSDFIISVAEELKISTSDVVFVGNSNNDELAVHSGAKTVVINPKLTCGYNREIWHYFGGVNVTDLREILPYLIPDHYLLGELRKS